MSKITGLVFTSLIVGCFFLGACTRREGGFNASGYDVIEVRPGLTCVFTNGHEAAVSCVVGSFPK